MRELLLALTVVRTARLQTIVPVQLLGATLSPKSVGGRGTRAAYTPDLPFKSFGLAEYNI